VDSYAKRVETNPEVVLVASKLKNVTMLVSEAHKQVNHVYMKKTAKRLNQAEEAKNLKYLMSLCGSLSKNGGKVVNL
jgi:hypothetical protein